MASEDNFGYLQRRNDRKNYLEYIYIVWYQKRILK